MPEIGDTIPPVPEEEIGLYTETEMGIIKQDLYNVLNEDVTFIGAMEIDGSVDISGNVSVVGNVWIDGSLDVSGAFDCSVLVVDGSADISGALDCSVLNVDGSSEVSDVWIAGDVSITGAWRPTSCVSNAGGFLDENDFASDASGSVASQQSIKVYVDNAVGGFVDRGDPANNDYDGTEWADIGDFTPGAWVEVNLNTGPAAVPTTAKAVLLNTMVQATAGDYIAYRDSANANVRNIGYAYVQTAAVQSWEDIITPLTAGKIDVLAGGNDITSFTNALMTVKGWWL